MTINRKICPAGLKNNPNRAMNKVGYITIHCTGNYSAAANARMHADYQYAGSGGKQASWHYTVDKGEIWQSFEDKSECWHAGDGGGLGNTASIGIEICVNDKAGFKEACNNAAWLVSELLKQHGIGIGHVAQHNKWSGKGCPAQLRSGEWGVTWDAFLALVRQYMGQPHADATAALQSDTAPQGVVTFDLLGEKVDIPGQLIGGHNYVQARALLEALGFVAGWEDGVVTARVKR